MKQILFILLFTSSVLITKAQSISISGNSKLIMRGNVSLVVRNAALVNNGTLIDSNGTVQFSGDKDTVFSYLGGSSATSVYNLHINKGNFGAAMKSKVAVQNVLGVYNGILYPDSNLTLLSDKDLTARVDVIPVTANIKGKAIVERYFPKRRAWRLVTSPLTKTPSIFDTWQNKGVYTAAQNTFVTGPNPTGPGGNGLDVSPQNNSSMKTWNVNTQALEAVSNTYANLSQGTSGTADNTGYFLFVRGDRDLNNFNTAYCNNTTLSSNGQLQVGTQNFTASSNAGGYTLIGNPYASPVDFNSVSRTNLVKRFYVWDPSLNMVGGYVMLDDLDNNGIYTKSINASAQTNHIQSGQAFFVETQTNGAANLRIGEGSKSAGNNNALFRPAAEPGGIQSLRITLHLKENDSTSIVADGVLFEGAGIFSKAIDRDDALKFSNINETMSLLRNGYPLAAERSEKLTENDTLFIRLQRTTQRSYQFETEPAGIDDPLLTAWLEDSYLQTSVPVNMNAAALFDFTIDGNTASANANRFRIVFRRSSVLPVTIVSVNAALQDEKVLVKWVVENEINIRGYEVEKSVDGIYFTAVHNTMATAGASTQYQYRFTDNQPFNGITYYRIKYTDNTGSIHYSIIVKVIKEKAAHPVLTVYPNPIENNIINMQFAGYEPGKYQALLINEAGQTVYETFITVSNSNGKATVVPGVQLAAGNYLLKVTGTNASSTQKLVVK